LYAKWKKKPQQIVTQHILTTKVFVQLLNIQKVLEDSTQYNLYALHILHSMALRPKWKFSTFIKKITNPTTTAMKLTQLPL
jgi:hypothetical protein